MDAKFFVIATRPSFRPCCQITQIVKRFYSAPGDGEVPAAKQKYVPTSGVYPKGFRVSSTHVGVKASNTKFDDLCLITSDKDCAVSGVFTKNIFKAAPVLVSRSRLKRNGIRNIIINSGCANAVTGSGGLTDALSMCHAADAALNMSATELTSSVVMSTGVIGQRLPINKILAKVPKAAEGLGDDHDHWLATARAICTTDTFPKLISRQFRLPNVPGNFTMTGMAKGAGMIAPNMGTLLSVVCTDAPIARNALRSALESATKRSFNQISIDGDTSTNDTVICMANGAAAEADATTVDYKHEAASVFTNELTALCTDLAKLVVRDGEGATKFITIRVKCPKRLFSDARLIARSIGTSSLVKTALYGQDANWGRILCAIGYTPTITSYGAKATVVPEQTSVSFVPAAGSEGFAELKLLVNGEPQDVDEELAARMVKEEDLEILVDLRSGEEVEDEVEAVFWTCDFSHEYVTINGDYRT